MPIQDQKESLYIGPNERESHPRHLKNSSKVYWVESKRINTSRISNLVKTSLPNTEAGAKKTGIRKSMKVQMWRRSLLNKQEYKEQTEGISIRAKTLAPQIKSDQRRNRTGDPDILRLSSGSHNRSEDSRAKY
ncbi:hypothetical protein C922_03730 [Plasmodium inui San Antonio 1]|uniref:Uncharacterized protein n=1 Tax=Plasmodium inui San Antonio 1 TaxID=1237626 RepID=W6ZY46_9APIC|nr:hypothetical protein C922_03730 [Plasmodium inui San Antonio 1]EUD65747.1 hypothetical protein C922_03730 [Plasmodium inui San Antonio 1]